MIIKTIIMKKAAVFIAMYLGVLLSCFAQKESQIYTRPKLVVGIVVDQMRYDYLTRFYNKYSEGGFKRMINEGFNCKNNHFNYIPTKTAPGHASIYTGTTPKYHGVIGNNWYNASTHKMMYCTSDSTQYSVGALSPAGKMSPTNMQTSTFPDQNRLFTQMRGKTIGVALKDRGAILPAGHTANAAYWFYGKNKGHFISSSYYMDSLPKWVNRFNASKKAASYFKTWKTLYNINTYKESGADLNTFETGFKDVKENATFPYDLSVLKDANNRFDILKSTAFGNSLTTDFAIEAIKGEALGKDMHTDVLTISYSSTDYVGHNFGVNSKEIQDTYLRLDKDIARLFSFLDARVGKGNYTVFLTADHGAVQVPAYLQSVHIPAGYFQYQNLKKNVIAFLEKTYKSKNLLLNISNEQVFLNTLEVEKLGLDLERVEKAVVRELLTYKNINKAYTASTMHTTAFTKGVENLLQNGYHQKRSGQILFVPETAFIAYSKKGSTHGSGLNYDTHVPLLFLGKGIKHGQTYKPTRIIDIAPTMSVLLGISFPNAATGQPLEFVLN